jgi:opacity protein-like surface antigen
MLKIPRGIGASLAVLAGAPLAVLAAALLAVLAASPAQAAGWTTPAYTLRLNSFATSDAFPGSLNSGPDQGLEPRAELATSRRFAAAYKLGLTASAGGTLQNQFTRGNYAWLGVGSSLRRDQTTLTLEGQWTPKRNKFPTDPAEGGEFAGTELTAGVRRSLGERARVRLEGSLERDQFVPQFSDRDSQGRGALGVFTLTPSRGIELRAEGSWDYDNARAQKWDKFERWTGAGVVWSDFKWRSDLGLRSGVRSYDHAIAGQANFLRRDQWIELRLRLTRVLAPGLAASLGASAENQTSSRADRAFNQNTVTLGLEWSGGGK